jgi:DNA-binding transcriptional regulator YhcF (GntR family)
MVQSTSNRRADDPTSAAAPMRPRGRPPKPELKSRPSEGDFKAVKAAVIALALREGGAWAAAKERVRNWADREKGFSPATPKVLGYLLEHINLDKGCDWHSAETIARELGISVRTVERAFEELCKAGYILRCLLEDAGMSDVLQQIRCNRNPKASKPWATTLPILVAAGKASGAPDKKTREDPSGNARTRQEKQGGPDENVGQIRKGEYADDDGSARARENPDDAIHSFLNGEAFVSPSPPNGVTEQQLECFRQLGDTFGRRQGAIINRPTTRSESDPMLSSMVRSELGDLPSEMVARVVTAALDAVIAAQVRDNQEGTVGRGRGGLPSARKYLLKVLRDERSDLLRAHAADEAKNRTERIVHEEVLEKRVQGIRSAGGSKKRNSSWEDVAADLDWETTYATAQGGT